MGARHGARPWCAPSGDALTCRLGGPIMEARHRQPGGSMRRPEGASALVIGGRDLAAPLHLAQVPVTVVSRPRAPARFSRYTSGWLEDPRPRDDALAAAVLLHAADRADPVALFYEQDEDVLFV